MSVVPDRSDRSEREERKAGSRGRILVDRELRELVGGALRAVEGAAPIEESQIQPASVDLRLGRRAHRIEAGFLPGRAPIEERLAELGSSTVDLEGEGGVLAPGEVFLIPLQEELDLPPPIHGRFNPRSSAGRCDLFTRILVPGHPRFDETPPGFSGNLMLQVSPLSFPVLLRRGDRLAQLRLQEGIAALGPDQLRELHRRTPVCFDGERPLEPEELRIDEEGALHLRVGLGNRSPSGWRAARTTALLRFAETSTHRVEDFWEPVHAHRGHCILEPGRFYIFASRERIRIPPLATAEMLPVDVGIGELRNNYAGFFDNGFGWSDPPSSPPGTPAVLEVRAHDVPFLVEDGQVLFRLRFFRTRGAPDRLYGQDRPGPSYRGQDLTLARPFRQ
jgi:dCTP deaminase